MDAEGDVVSEPTRSLRGFTSMHALATRLLALRAKGAAATPAEQQELFLIELQLDLIPGYQIEARASAWPLGAADKALVARKLVRVQVTAIVAEWILGSHAAAAKAVAMAKAGRTPSATKSGQFWQLVLEHASEQHDGELALRAFDALQQRYADEPSSWRDWRMRDWQQQLDAAKAR